MDVEQVARELCTADPAEFVPARDRAAAEAKERGDGELASALKKLRKPTTAAWAVNLLSDRDPDALETLLDLGERLRSAQRELRGDDLRSLAGERTSTLRDLTGRAAALAEEHGHPLTGATREQVEQTLTAALSDPEAARAVRSATLTKPLEYSGFGLDEVAATAVLRASQQTREPAQQTREPAERPREAGSTRGRTKEHTRGTTERRGTTEQSRGTTKRTQAERAEQERLAEARDALRRSEAELDEAADALESAERAERAAEERCERLRDEIDELRARLEQRRDELERAEDEQRELRRETKSARQRRERARRDRDAAEERVRGAEGR
ncbi:hypothetical protein [Saccharopolyspora hordei]|uniref:Prefoldin subunit 5 n=1 Tax=Saccharopolyspora hordei TaxID=1838 RepID=A0A853ANG5_9PSEU|nr:hypothetical protein [Saccharopolyspora hordei]NYI85698.1 prefoldin subunit 5 [Saccharopolyspora hordei]